MGGGKSVCINVSQSTSLLDIIFLFLFYCSGERVPEGAGMEEPFCRVRAGRVHVPHGEDQGARPQGDP